MSAPDCDLANDRLVETRCREGLPMRWAVGQPWTTDCWLIQASSLPEARQPFPNHLKICLNNYNVSFVIVKDYTVFSWPNFMSTLKIQCLSRVILWSQTVMAEGAMTLLAGNKEEKWWKVYQVNRIAGQVFLTSKLLRMTALLFKATVIEGHKSECKRQPSATNIALFTYLTDSVEQSHSWEAKWFADSRETPRILWNPKVHYHIALHLLIKNANNRTFLTESLAV